MFRRNPWFTVQYRAVHPFGQIPYGKWMEVNKWFSSEEKAQRWINENASFFEQYSVCRNYGETPKGMVKGG